MTGDAVLRVATVSVLAACTTLVLAIARRRTHVCGVMTRTGFDGSLP